MDSLIATNNFNVNNTDNDQNSVLKELDEHFLENTNSPITFDWTKIEDLFDRSDPTCIRPISDLHGPIDLLDPPATDLPLKMTAQPSATFPDNTTYIQAPR